MCRTHSALIDRDENYFTAEMLKKWKENAERDAGKELIAHLTKDNMDIGYKDVLRMWCISNGIQSNKTVKVFWYSKYGSLHKIY